MTNWRDTQHGGDHYKDMSIEPVDYIFANKLGWFEGTIIKHVSRHRKKNGAEDLRKAMHYLEMLLDKEYGETYWDDVPTEDELEVTISVATLTPEETDLDEIVIPPKGTTEPEPNESRAGEPADEPRADEPRAGEPAENAKVREAIRARQEKKEAENVSDC